MDSTKECCGYRYAETYPGFYPRPTIRTEDGKDTPTNLLPLKEEGSCKKTCPLCGSELEESQYLFWTHKN